MMDYLTYIIGFQIPNLVKSQLTRHYLTAPDIAVKLLSLDFFSLSQLINYNNKKGYSVFYSITHMLLLAYIVPFEQNFLSYLIKEKKYGCYQQR